jgi:flagellar hook-associated protein 1 FlgK
MGVEVAGVVQKIDHYLVDRLRGATSDRADAEIREQAYVELESIIGELGEADLSTALDEFFGSIHEILNQPESIPVRQLAALKGERLADEIRRLHDRVGQVRDDADDQVADLASDVNRLVREIAELNRKIAENEGGDTTESDAVGLRDHRHKALADLAELVEIKVREQPDGSVTVFAGGDFLVFHKEFREVSVRSESIDGVGTNTIVIDSSNSPLALGGGKIAGLVGARDDVYHDFIQRLDGFSRTLSFEFNKLFSSGQGLRGYESLTSEATFDDAGAVLDEAGLPFTPTSGSFQVQVYNKLTGLTRTTEISIDLDGLGEDTTVADLVDELGAISGISASLNVDGELEIESLSPDEQFTFGADSSGVLAALGIHTFFTGTGAATIGVNEEILSDPAKFTASASGIGDGTDNAVLMAEFLDRPLDTSGGETLAMAYDKLTGETAQAASTATAVAEGFRVFEGTLEGQHLGVSGVSLDEEAVRLITFQRVYQASARYIATVSELLDMLVNL